MEEEAMAWPKALGWEAAVTLERLREAAMAESQLAARYAAETTQGPDQAEPGKALQRSYSCVLKVLPFCKGKS